MSPLDLLNQLDRMESHGEKLADERRSRVRVPVRAEAELQAMDPASMDRSAIAVGLRDIGRTGAGFVSPQPLEIDSCWHLSVFHKGHELARLGLIVRHCQYVDDGVYLAGGAFSIDTLALLMLGLEPATIDQMDQSRQPGAAVEGADQFQSPDQL